MNIFIRQTRQRDRQRTDYVHKKSKDSNRVDLHTITWFIIICSTLHNKVILADRTARKMIGSWHHNVVCPSVRRSACPSMTLCIVALRVSADG